MAKDRQARKDEPGVREYMEKLVLATNTAPACLRDFKADGCFIGVVALLREPPVGLLGQYEIDGDLLASVPRWTGSDSTGPRMQARIALNGMCAVPGRDALAQQRACIVLGDLVADERMRRCGPDCDATNKEALGGWSTAEVMDGYAAACKVDTAKIPNVDYAPFSDLVKSTYGVTSNKPVCDVASSAKKGASIPGALETAARIRADIKARSASADSAAKREAERMIAMEKMKVEQAAKAAAAEEAAFKVDVLAAIHRSDWAATFGMLTKRRGSSIDKEVSDALQKIWDPFTIWLIGQNGVAAAYLDLSSRLALAPKNHVIRVSLASLQEDALVAAKATQKLARGVGGSWLHAALVSRIAGPTDAKASGAASAAFAKLVATARTSLVLEALAPACSPIYRPGPTGGKTVKAKSTLQCTIEAEKTETRKEPFKVQQHVVGPDGEKDVEVETMVDVTHRTYKVVVHGVLAVYSGAPRQAIPIDYEEIVDDVDGSDPRKFDNAIKIVRDSIYEATVGALEAAEATKALTAAQTAIKNNRKEAAENNLVIHGVIAGSSPELDEVMVGYGISFAELVQPYQAK
jgi:hypothetical protein